MFPRKIVVLGSLQNKQPPGQPGLSQLQAASITTDGNVTLTTQNLAGGLVLRTGPNAAGFTDTLPAVDTILASVTDVEVGDSFTFLYNNTSNQTATIAAGSGITLAGTTTVATNKSREYLVTLLNTKRTTILVGTTVNADATLSGFTAAELAEVQPGMAVTGTGIGASAKVIGVQPDAGTIEVDVVSTADGTNIAITFTPQATVRGVRLADV